MTLAILVPVLARPGNVAPLLASIEATTPKPYRVVFIADPDDHAEQAAIPSRPGIDLMLLDGSYSQKINAGVDATTEPLVFTAADDLRFRVGWLGAARAKMTGAVQVVGVNDLIERRPSRQGHATHFLMAREYAERSCIDGSRGPMNERYSHSFVDDELIATAKYRGAYAYAEDSHVEHLHVINDKAPDDDTYRKGRKDFRRDRRVYLQRQRLWAK